MHGEYVRVHVHDAISTQRFVQIRDVSACLCVCTCMYVHNNKSHLGIYSICSHTQHTIKWVESTSFDDLADGTESSTL